MKQQPAPALEDAPVQLEEEWANALTHGIALVLSIGLSCYMMFRANEHGIGMMIACGAYSISMIGTFCFSWLSHTILRQPALNRLRAWDQAMIYLMISGTYTPIAFKFSTDSIKPFLLTAIWIAAFSGFIAKVAIKHRINSITTVTYLLLGWLPAIPLIGHVTKEMGLMMLLGGVLYSVGIIFLRLSEKVRYFHAVWHVFVLLAAVGHWLGILWYVL